MVDRDRDWDFHLRNLSNSARDSNVANDPASDPNILQSVKRLYELCKAENSEDLVARVYPHFNKIFQRSVSSLSQSRTSNGLLLLAILQFFIDFGELVLHDADPSLKTFFRSCLSREFADPIVAEAVLEIFNANFLVVALERVERSSGSLVGNSIASIQKSKALRILMLYLVQMLLALMDEAYTGSTIGDAGGDSESEDSSRIDVADPLFLELLEDENDGLSERHWTSPVMAAVLQTAINTPSVRLKQILNMTPRILDVYFSVALQEVNNSLICALVPLLMSRNSTLFPDKDFSYKVCKRLLEFMLAAFQRSPAFIALLKKPITDRLGEAYENPAKTELALQLCWAIGEHGGGGRSHKDAARELFESLELLLYENLLSSLLGMRQDSSDNSSGESFRKSSQSRLLCFVITAIAKLATYHRELLPRAQVSLGKVYLSRTSDSRVWTRAYNYLGLLSDPGVSLSILGPSRQAALNPGTDWSQGGTKMVAHIPFYILCEHEGPPFYDFSLSDILPKR
ncbi:LOW QUALITY PROTEIN: uncharacterized protein LOC111010525 [Momordica charantia]|uniref:LOW QUALITY PROTEIN: uncharacterized protein LOC111010525 n=1 Tax=Momordica charantia TaxID=3673 RepID=A0A6J1CEM6_MOMCH|nr:LOW QUALITY PROTEIN: uncharacterized protein LOC111010525 [Momordica charantia]